MYCWSKSRVLCLKRNKTWTTQELPVEKISWSLADILQLPWFNRQQITAPRAPLRIILQIFQNINSTEIIKIAWDGSFWSKVWPCCDLTDFRACTKYCLSVVKVLFSLLCEEREAWLPSAPKEREASPDTWGAWLGTALSSRWDANHWTETSMAAPWATQTRPPYGVWGPAIRSRAFSKSQSWMTLAFNGRFLPLQCL